MKKISVESGQALVLVLLSLAVVLTIVLFILSRTVTDIAVSSTSEEAVRAFSAAEAGVEKALVVGSSSSSPDLGNGAKYSANVTSVGQGKNTFNYPILLNSGDSGTLWFVAHDTSNGDSITCSAGLPCFTGKTVRVCWGQAGTSASSATTPAVELSVFYETTPGDPGTTQIARATFDPNSGRAAGNAFSAPDSGTCTVASETGTQTYQFQKTIDLSTLGIPLASYGTENGLQFAKVRFFYNTDLAHSLGFDINFSGNFLLPSQGSQIDSTGTAGSSNRRLNVFQGWPEVPSVLEGAIYSSTGLTK